MLTTLEATQGQILSQSPTNAASERKYLNGSRLQKNLFVPGISPGWFSSARALPADAECGPHLVQIWSRNPPKVAPTKPTQRAEWDMPPFNSRSGIACHPVRHVTGGTLQPTPHTPHPTPQTPHPTPPHPTPYSLLPIPNTSHPTPYTLHPARYTPHLTPCTLHPTPYALNPKP